MLRGSRVTEVGGCDDADHWNAAAKDVEGYLHGWGVGGGWFARHRDEYNLETDVCTLLRCLYGCARLEGSHI